MDLARRHQLNCTTGEHQRLAFERLALYTIGNECDVTIQVVVRLEAKRREPGRTQDKAR